MANRQTTEPARHIDALNQPDINRLTIQKPRLSDDVLTALANAPENRRAQQVSEWERLRRQSVRAAAR